jgi:SAM-dependent methyltransferase
MQFTWEDQSIRWFIDASEYTGFHKTLAQMLLPYLKSDDSVCDMGCGLGRLDLELAPYVSDFTSIDLSSQCIDILSADAAKRGLTNLNARVQDASEPGQDFDIIIMTFFGQSGMAQYLKRTRRKIIRVVSATNSSGLFPERHRSKGKTLVADVQDELARESINYTLKLDSIEFGQPLSSESDAKKYILKNAPDASDDEVTEFFKEKVSHTGRQDFPFYLPHMKEFGIFLIDKES